MSAFQSSGFSPALSDTFPSRADSVRLLAYAKLQVVGPFVFVASSDASGAVAYSAVGDFETVMAMHEGAAHKQVAHKEGDLARRLEGCA